MEVPETPRCPAAATEQVAAATAETRGSDRARAEAATKAVGDEEVSGGDDGGGDRDGGGGEDALPFDGAGGGGDGGGGDEAVPSGGDAAWARWRCGGGGESDTSKPVSTCGVALLKSPITTILGCRSPLRGRDGHVGSTCCARR